jgi:hypothetical protein
MESERERDGPLRVSLDCFLLKRLPTDTETETERQRWREEKETVKRSGNEGEQVKTSYETPNCLFWCFHSAGRPSNLRRRER